MGIKGTFSERTVREIRKLSTLNFRVNTTITTCTRYKTRRFASQIILAASVLFLTNTVTRELRAQSAPIQQSYSSSAQSTDVEVASLENRAPEAETKAPTRSAPAANVAGAAPSREKGLFRSWRLEALANSLGGGFTVSTPLARHFDLRGGANLLSFGSEFDVDGLHYDSRIKLRSGNLRLDWFPRHGRNFHISPGILYANNYVTAPSHVPAGEHFTLGDENFINSVDDPVHGDARLTFPRRVSPMLTAGFRNILPGEHRHISVPLEFGVAYVGAPTLSVSLTGTACQQDGCFSFADNADAQQGLRDEIRDINDTLSNVPVYPVVSLGFGYRF